VEVTKRGPVLIVEDGDEDFDMFRRAYVRAGATHELVRCTDGDEALEYLARTTDRPSLVLLDLNLPGLDGREVLRELRASDPHRAIPIMVLSTSNSPRDVELCYREGANCYAVKPIGLERLERLVSLIKEFWLEAMELPGVHR